MIRPEGFSGAAFGTASDGDARTDPEARRRMSDALGIVDAWATVRGVHGTTVALVEGPGHHDDADGLATTVSGLPIAVGSGDCLPVVIEGDGGVAAVHAGWRGTAAGILGAARRTLRDAGIEPTRAAIGPAIGPCCFEVGPEVAARFPDAAATTTWGTPSVDLRAAAAADLDGLDLWVADVCTSCGDGYHSHRATATLDRQVTVAWVPTD